MIRPSPGLITPTSTTFDHAKIRSNSTGDLLANSLACRQTITPKAKTQEESTSAKCVRDRLPLQDI